MKYKTRDNDVLVSIQGVYLIIADVSSWDECSYCVQTNEMGAIIWKLLRDERSIDDIIFAINQEFDIPDQVQLLQDIENFIEELKKRGHLLERSKL